VIKSRRLKCAKNAATMRDIRNTKKLSWEPGKWRLVGKPSNRWEDSSSILVYSISKWDTYWGFKSTISALAL
jgi:hypothetical protein